MKRYLVVAALFVLSLITYLDRAAISSAKGPIASDLSLSDEAMGAVFSAFALGYALAQIPSGWFADRAGPRLALSAVVFLWSILTALTGVARSFGSLLFIRFLFGTAEAGAFPGSARAFYNWLPVEERGLANGIIFSGARLGAAAAFPIFAWLLTRYSWRVAFYLIGFPGLVWALLWLLLFRNHPREPIRQETPSAGPPMSFVQVLRSRAMALNMAQYFASNFTFFICLTWMHPYLKEQYRLSQQEAATYVMIPLLFGATAQWVSGFLVDVIYRSRYRAWSRRLPAMTGFLLAAAGVLAVSLADTAASAVACFTVATFGAEMTISPSWAYCIDIGAKNSGAVSGSMNMAGNFGSFVSANAFPQLYRLTGSAAAYFRSAALLNVAAILCWYFMRPRASSQP